VNDPIGVILAGGRGRRIGGAKATVSLCGKALICYPLEALRAALADVAILAKPDSELPSLPGVTVWVEPQLVSHPLIGIRHALALARGRPVLVCAVDMPFVTADLITRVASADPGGCPAVIASRADGTLEPLLGCYRPSAATLLGPAADEASEPLRDVVARLEPRLVEVDEPQQLFNVNSPEDLLHAASVLDASRRSRSSTEQAG
jgi:molybdenum cofactor guanylyltransferase